MISSIFQQLTIEDWRRCRHIGPTIFHVDCLQSPLLQQRAGEHLLQFCILHPVIQSK